MAFNIDQISKQAELAIKALTEHLKKDDDDLLETDRGLWIHIQLAKTIETKTTKQLYVLSKRKIIDICLSIIY